MSRVKLSEYCAKSLFVRNYKGVSLKISSIERDVERLDESTMYILKVDQGIKKRGKQGLIRLNVNKMTAVKMAYDLFEKGFIQLIAEPMVSHSDEEEQYLSLERVRSGYRILHSKKGGVGIEDNAIEVSEYVDVNEVPLPGKFLDHIVQVMEREHLSFVEINPLIIRGDEGILLDAAVLADSAGEKWSQWSKNNVVEPYVPSDSEVIVNKLNEGSSASFSFRILNPDGAIWLLLSGGGASITIADEAANRNKAGLIGNYGEYSGGPTREETKLYAEAVIKQALESKSPRKALVVAGGVANFTDVKKTFSGIIDALSGYAGLMREQNFMVYVRRGGPNEEGGLEMMKKYLESEALLGSVHGSEDVLTIVIDEALEHVDA